MVIAGFKRALPGSRQVKPAIVGSIAGNVDDPALAFEGIVLQEPHAIVNSRYDRGGTGALPSMNQSDQMRERLGIAGPPKMRPGDDHFRFAGSAPLRDDDGRAKRFQAFNSRYHVGIAEGAGKPLNLQGELGTINACRTVESEDKFDGDRLRRLRRRGQRGQGDKSRDESDFHGVAVR